MFTEYAKTALLNTLEWILGEKKKTINDSQIASTKGQAVKTSPVLSYYKREVVYRDSPVEPGFKS